MMTRRTLLLATALLATSCTAPRRPPTLEAVPRPSLRVQVGGSIVTVPLEEYVRVVVLSEVGPQRGSDAARARTLELQAIVSRTYAFAGRHAGEAFDVCSTTHCQLYRPGGVSSSRWAVAAALAVRKTTGRIVRFGGEPAKVVYHADCGGHTSAARDVWRGEPLPYLAAVADRGPAAAAHAKWRFAPPVPALLEALNADPRTYVGARLERIDVVRRDAGSRADLVALAGERAPLVRGEELRVVLNRAFGARALRSTRFQVTRANGVFEFTGQGFGHGVGLCQAGAFARLAAGATVEEVLAFYFPGTSVG
jgi:stage II sporulation protein D